MIPFLIAMSAQKLRQRRWQAVPTPGMGRGTPTGGRWGGTRRQKIPPRRIAGSVRQRFQNSSGIHGVGIDLQGINHRFHAGQALDMLKHQ